MLWRYRCSYSGAVSTPPKLRPDLDQLPGYRAGARAAGAVSLASNENSTGLLPGLAEIIATAAKDVHRYPDPAANRLLQRLSEHLHVHPDQIALGTGSVAICQQITAATCSPGDEVVYAWRSFEAYPIVTRLAHARSVQVPLLPDSRHDLPAMAAAITDRTRVVFVCTPNNPTGPAIPTAELAEFLDQVPPEVLVVVDEAYYEYAAASGEQFGGSLSLLDQHPKAMVLRTFSKAYGLAGLRVGYGVADPSVVQGLRKAATPFGVNHLAQEVAAAALELSADMEQQVAATVVERERVLAAVRAQGWPVPDTQGNFYWLPLGADTEAVAEACKQAGVLVRAFPGEGVRVTIGDQEPNETVLDVLSSYSPTN